MMKKEMLAIAAASMLLQGSAAFAAISDQEFAQLKADFASMAQRLSALELENSRLRELGKGTESSLAVVTKELASVQTSAASSWTDRIKVKGDFRYRYEEIDVQGKGSRERNRIRARASLTAKLANNVEVALGVASGGDDPVSTNQTLGGGGSTKDVRLDLAYFKWNASDQFYLTGGKVKNFWYRPQKSQLLWDGDYNPEGLGAAWSSEHFFIRAGGNWLESDSKKSNKQFSWGLQGGSEFTLGQSSVTVGVGYFDLSTKGKASFFGDDDDFYGNSFECSDPNNLSTCVYKYNYEEIEVFATMSMNVADLPLRLFADYVENLDADQFDTGFILGAKLGKASSPGSWEAGYAYQDLEADAAFGLLSDSDFAGGGTDGKGHRITGAYAINKQWKFGFTWFLNNEAGDNRGSAVDYDRFMLDTSFKY
jgi:hypothetical protein